MIDFAAIRQAATGSKPAPKPQEAKPAPAMVPVVQESVRITPISSSTHVGKPDEQWSWENLRDYVMRQIEDFHGPQIRNAVKEKAIFEAFMVRYGADAPRIARYAFEVNRGMWQRAPISVTRFCKGSDPYFGDKIQKRLA